MLQVMCLIKAFYIILVTFAIENALIISLPRRSAGTIGIAFGIYLVPMLLRRLRAHTFYLVPMLLRGNA